MLGNHLCPHSFVGVVHAHQGHQPQDLDLVQKAAQAHNQNPGVGTLNLIQILKITRKGTWKSAAQAVKDKVATPQVRPGNIQGTVRQIRHPIPVPIMGKQSQYQNHVRK